MKDDGGRDILFVVMVHRGEWGVDSLWSTKEEANRRKFKIYGGVEVEVKVEPFYVGIPTFEMQRFKVTLDINRMVVEFIEHETGEFFEDDFMHRPAFVYVEAKNSAEAITKAQEAKEAHIAWLRKQAEECR